MPIILHGIKISTEVALIQVVFEIVAFPKHLVLTMVQYPG